MTSIQWCGHRDNWGGAVEKSQQPPPKETEVFMANGL